MAEGRYRARPVMGCGAGFDSDKAGLQLPKESEHGTSPQFLLQNDRTISINAEKLKDRLGQINPECTNLHVGDSFPLLGCDSTSMAHCDAVWVEPSTPSDECKPASARTV
jgi:hypothetical protein